jgi:hypothetical protein
MRLLTFALVVTLASPVAGQQAVRDNAPVSIPTGSASVAGVVRDETGSIVRRATVTVTGERRFSLSTVTDTNGRFALDGLPAGRVTITVRKPGYPPMSYGAAQPNRAGSGVFLAEGQQVRDLPLVLMRGGVLAGTILDERGQPLPDMTIMAWEVRTTLAGERTLDFPSTGGEGVTSDERGNYRIYGLPPGEYTVGTFWAYRGLPGSARIPTAAEFQAAFAPTARPGIVGGGASPTAADRKPIVYNYARVYLPSDVNPLTAATVKLTAGQVVDGLDLRMPLVPQSRLQGLVLGPDGPASRVQIEVQSRSVIAALRVNTVSGTGPDGKFGSDALAPGDYSIRASIPAVDGRPAMWASADITVAGAEPVSVTLQLAPAMRMAGRLVFESTNSAAAIPSGVRLTVVPVLGANSPPSATASADGLFVIDGVAPGRMRLQVNAGAAATGWMLRSVRWGDREIVDQPFDIVPGPLPNLTLTFTDQVSELTGTLTDAKGQAAPNYYVIVVPADRAFWLQGSRRIANTRPDGRGFFAFRSLPPGEYRIAATTDLVPRDLQDASALERLLRESAPVTVGVGEKKVFDIRLAR